MYKIIDEYNTLTEPKIPNMIPPMVDYPLASLVECMRLILFIFIVTVSMSLSQLATSTVGLLVDIVSNFDEHFGNRNSTNAGQQQQYQHQQQHHQLQPDDEKGGYEELRRLSNSMSCYY